MYGTPQNPHRQWQALDGFESFGQMWVAPGNSREFCSVVELTLFFVKDRQSNEGNFITEHFFSLDVGSCAHSHHVSINIKISNIMA